MKKVDFPFTPLQLKWIESLRKYPERQVEGVNGDEMGVNFASWLARDPKQLLKNDDSSHSLSLFWERNFYPDIQVVANDLHTKGLIPEGDYVINIDW